MPFYFAQIMGTFETGLALQTPLPFPVNSLQVFIKMRQLNRMDRWRM